MVGTIGSKPNIDPLMPMKSKPWCWSEVLLVGEGRVGKTALLNSIIGKPLVKAECTRSWTQLNLSSNNGTWTEHARNKVATAEDGTKLLSIYDFESRYLFKIFNQLFLRSNRVYVVVFNMVNALEQSLHELSYWINSIVINCAQGSKTHIFLVGTHKDLMSDIYDHRRISEVIEARFRYNSAWASIEEYNDLCFFPVNNLIVYGDKVILDLKSAIESLLSEEFIPLSWLRALDELIATKKCYLAMDEASLITRANGVGDDALPLFLSFLNEMSTSLWLDEEGLRNVVILDVITFFVEPATLIIHNDILKPLESTIHFKKIQELFSQNNPSAWNQIMSMGIIGRDLLCVLLGHLVETSNIPAVIRLMLRYGLIVRLEHRASRELPDEYLVPAHLPAIAHISYWSEWNDVRRHSTCYFVFCTHKDTMLSCLRPSHLKSECFLPQGLMERLLGRVSNEDTQLYQNYAVLSCERQQIRLVCFPEINCIRLDIEGEHPLSVHNNIHEHINSCVKEYMGSLQFATTLLLRTTSNSEDEFVLLNLEAVSCVQMSGRSLLVKGFGPLDRVYVAYNYGSWVKSELHEMEYKDSLRESYIPESIREDWEWFANRYTGNEITRNYFQKYALLHKKQLSEITFNSETEAFNFLSQHEDCGAVVHVGPKYNCTDILMATAPCENRFLVSIYALFINTFH